MRVAIGDIVHYVMPGGRHRPAIVIECGDQDQATLHVFGTFDDAPEVYAPTYTDIREGVPRDLDPKEYTRGTWHFPEKE